MFPKPYLFYLQRVAKHITAPSVNINDQEQRQQARLLASISLVLFIATLVITPIWIETTPAFVAARYISLGLLLAIILTYGLSRTRFYLAGAVVLTFTILGLVGVTFFTAPGPVTERMLALNFLIVAIMISALFLRRLAFLVVGLSLITIGAFFFVPNVPFAVTYSYLVFFLVVIALGTAYGSLSERHKQRLYESEEKYRTVVSTLSEGIILQTHAGTIAASNKAAEKFLGLTADQLRGSTFFDPGWRTIHEDGSPFPAETYPAIVTLRTGKPFFGVIMGVHRPNGDLRWISINSQPIMKPGAALPYAVVASFIDITERKRDERALKEAQHRYYALFEQANDAVFILDLEGRHIEANRRAANLLGYDVSEIQHLTYKDLSAELQKSERILARLLAGEQLPVYERMFRKKDGSLIPVEINVELVHDVDGNPLHIQSVVRDITERKQTQQQEFELALEKERTQVLSGFIQDASHEFKTPLSIINTAAFIMTQVNDPEKRLSRAAIIQAQVKRLTKLTNMLLLITRLENGPPAEKMPVDIGEIFEAAFRQMNAQYSDPPIVHFSGEPNLPRVTGNPHELKEAIWQILDNACRFTPRGGVIISKTGATEDYVWLVIGDSGPGIPSESLHHIFNTFWREDKAHTTPGFGLGLAIAKKIINKHGGKIEVTSEKGEGTTFRTLLPMVSN